MNTLQHAFTILLASLLLLTACRKPQTKTDLFTAHTWIFDHTTPKDDSVAIKSAALHENAVYTFNRDHTYHVVFQGQPLDGTWSFSEDETKLTLINDMMGKIVFDLAELDESKLAIRTLFQGSVVTWHFVVKE